MASVSKVKDVASEILKSAKQSKFLKKISKVDPRDRFIAIFPDANHVRVGTGFKLINNSAAERVFLRASEILDTNILKICLEGPKEKLCDNLVNKNIAAFISAKAAMAKLINEKPYLNDLTTTTAGIGVGTINMLEFAGCISFENALDLVIKRAEGIDRANKIVPAYKLRVKLRPATQVHKVCQAAIDYCVNEANINPDISICSVTSKLTSNIVEIGGHEKAIEYLETHGTRLFDFRYVRRMSSEPAGYHTALMKPVSEFLRLYIEDRIGNDNEYLRDPRPSLYPASIAKRVQNLRDIKFMIHQEVILPAKVEHLFFQLYSRDKSIYQPNTLIVADKSLLIDLSKNNRKAHDAASLIEV